MKLKKEFGLILLAFVLPVVSALDFSSGITDNEWFMFTIFFVFFFGVVYFSSFKTFDQNRGITAVISGAVALIVSISLTKRTAVYSVLNESTANILFLIAGLIGTFYLIKFTAFKKTAHGKEFSLPRCLVGIGILLIIVSITDFYTILPEALYFSFIGDILSNLSELADVLLILLGVYAVIMVVKTLKKKNE